MATADVGSARDNSPSMSARKICTVRQEYDGIGHRVQFSTRMEYDLVRSLLPMFHRQFSLEKNGDKIAYRFDSSTHNLVAMLIQHTKESVVLCPKVEHILGDKGVMLTKLDYENADIYFITSDAEEKKEATSERKTSELEQKFTALEEQIQSAFLSADAEEKKREDIILEKIQMIDKRIEDLKKQILDTRLLADKLDNKVDAEIGLIKQEINRSSVLVMQEEDVSSVDPRQHTPLLQRDIKN